MFLGYCGMGQALTYGHVAVADVTMAQRKGCHACRQLYKNNRLPGSRLCDNLAAVHGTSDPGSPDNDLLCRVSIRAQQSQHEVQVLG